jgi:SAM-dependent methyltransferase
VPTESALARKLMQPLRRTILHPQWLVLRNDDIQRAWVREHAQGRVLDVGCADGRAREWVENCEYIGLDHPATAVAMYGTRPDLFADGAALPFADATFDTVLLLEVLEHVADARGTLAEIARVLKPGAMLLISVPFLYPIHDAPHDYSRFTAPGIDQSLRELALVPVSQDLRSPGFEAVAFLASVACAEAALVAWREKSWRLVIAPFALLAVPFVNMFGWIATRVFSTSLIITSGYAIRARKQ